MTGSSVKREDRAILVLGAAVWPGGRPSHTLARRTAEAARLWHLGKARIVIPCGGVGRFPPSEAHVMKGLLTDAGVPQSAIIPEDRSTSTAQNVAFAKVLLDQIGYTDVLIVSDAYHLPRARLLARRAGLRVETGAPPLRGVRIRTFLKGALRELPAYPAAYFGISRR